MEYPQQEGIEIWGGMECSVNRVKNNYYDQLQFAGHYSRIEDLERIAELGIKKIRYPVIWENHKPAHDTIINWADMEKRLNKLRELDIDPIAGLVHHGSGPVYATIETEQFAYELAKYAKQVAEKFPWINYYTPINEPLTTARFCGLYGVWYPHEKNTVSFFRLLINECKATVLAMEAIRQVNPNAKLVQSEDLSKTYSSDKLKTQAAYENRRRWLGFDLLCGRVNEDHSLWEYLLSIGIEQHEFEFFWENNCPPDIVGFNHYPTSERYLDDRIENFPESTHGTNGEHIYADVEAVRVKLEEENGAKLLLKEAWERLKTPMVLTEVHLGCTREEQLRWLDEIYRTVQELRQEGVDIRAITAWALLGSHGWTELITSPPGIYEPGVFDIRGEKPRETALGKMLRSLSQQKEFNHPVLENKGWWKRDIRILYFHEKLSRQITAEAISSQPILIIGKTGTLGKAFARLCEIRGLPHKLVSRQELDITKPALIEQMIVHNRPWAIVNAAGFVKVDEAEADIQNCFLANTAGPANLAVLCKKYNIKLLTFSSDLVFDGKKSRSYTESDAVSPLNIYGKSKAEAEKLVLQADSSALIIRTSAFFGPWDRYNFVHDVLASVKKNTPFAAANDVYISPTYVPDLVNSSLDLLIDNESGVWHLANSGEITWAKLAAEVAQRGGFINDLIHSVPSSSFMYKAKRPAYSVLNSERAVLLPDLGHALDRYFKEQELILL